jgi:hypothetical protein
MLKFVFSILIFAAIVPVTALAQEEQYVLPVDEAKSNPSFLAFRTRLVDAVKRRDAAYVLSIVDPQIRINFGDGGGIAAFKKEWKNLGPSSKFWDEFGPVISNGGRFSKEPNERDGTFWAPYVFDQFPPELDATEYAAIFGNNVNLREAPDLNAKIVTRLSYNIVRIEPETLPKSGVSEYPGWWQVTTLGGLRGFVKREYVRSPIDYRAGFEKKRGAWKMVTFVAGD